ncbi:MAG: protein kinase [Myxococcota bacterium]|nr:protein kinase [Myxococcota bacterium]MDW8362868.1 protein kinase [Myxococcales bacterium]
MRDSERSPPVTTGRLGPYTLVDRLAVGGMAEVFRALEPRPAGEPRLVVVKRMLPHVAEEPGASEMFELERRLGAAVRHPNVVELFAAGEKDGQPYLVLEYVRGVDLWRLMRHLLRTGQALDPSEALYVGTELLAGLHAVHEAHDAEGRALEMVHRDVSPSNVLLSVHGDVKLGDFGIAHPLRAQFVPASSSLAARAKGKLGYLSPEQVSGARADRRSDVFSAAVIVAELLMGRPLFAGGSELAVLLAIRDANIHPWLEYAARLPAGLGEVIARALARDPSRRTPSAEALRRELLPYQTRPETDVRRALAARVAAATAAHDSGAGLDRATPVALRSDLCGLETPVVRGSDAAPAQAHDEQLTPVGGWTHPEATTPVRSIDPDPIRYEVRTTDGRVLGPIPFAQVVEAVATGRIGPDDLVRADDDAFRPVREVTSLRRHLPASSLRTTLPPPEPGQAPAAPPAPSQRISLADGGIISALASSALRGATGLWLCEQGDIRKEVYVDRGRPTFVTSNLASELLGEYLVARGVISRGELEMALAVMPRFEGRLGDTLAALGLVEPVQLFQHIATQVREKLLDLFTWTRGEAAFYQGVSGPESGFPLALDVWEILEDGIRRRVVQGLEDARFAGRGDSVLVAIPALSTEVREAPLPADARRLLAVLSRPRPLRELHRMFDDRGGRDPRRAERAIVLLLHVGAIRWA